MMNFSSSLVSVSYIRDLRGELLKEKERKKAAMAVLGGDNLNVLQTLFKKVQHLEEGNWKLK